MKNTSTADATDPTQWLEAHGDYLFRYAKKHLRNDSAAEDMVQETLLAAYQARDQFSGNSSHRTWLAAILNHKIADFVRKHSRETPFAENIQNNDEDPDELSARIFDKRGGWLVPERTWGNPDATFEQSKFFEALALCFENLSPKLAATFSLRELSGLSIEEICETLKISSSNCSVILYRARMVLKECLETNWLIDNNRKDA